MLRIKRTYTPPAREDGHRILVERLWPRGMTKAALAADTWMKEVAPSAELRKWFGHRPERWVEFRERYWKELDSRPEAWEPLAEASGRGTITLLYSARDTLHNGALALRDYLVERRSSGPRRKSNVRRRARMSHPSPTKSGHPNAVDR